MGAPECPWHVFERQQGFLQDRVFRSGSSARGAVFDRNRRMQDEDRTENTIARVADERSVFKVHGFVADGK